MTSRAAIYARMSTDRQSSDSPADQIARCREYAARRGLDVVLVDQDAAVSGFSRHDRPGLLRVMAQIDAWDTLLVWDGSRIARDMEDFGWVLNELEEHGRDGYDVMANQPLASFGSRIMGVVNAEERRKIKANTHRGLRGRVERKLAAGAAPYGYRTERIGEGQGSRIVVHPAEADVVCRIFASYAAGDGIKAIAKRLNAEGVATPRPRGHQRNRPRCWSPNAIREMLRNELYRGELVWNRSRWVKRRRGGRRRAERPESEWMRQRDPAWVIVDEDLWAAVQERIAERRGACRHESRSLTGHVPAGPARSPQARALLAGLLQCSACGGAFCSISRGVATCSWRRARGACTSALRVPYAELERRVLGAVREQLVLPGADYVVERTLQLVRQRRADPGLEAKRARLAELPGEIARLVDLATRVDGLEEIADRLSALKRERDRLAADLRAVERAALDLEVLRTALAERLRALDDALGADPERARRALQELFRGEGLRVGPDPERGFRVEGTAWLALGALPGPLGPREHQAGSGGLLHAQSVVEMPVGIAA